MNQNLTFDMDTARLIAETTAEAVLTTGQMKSGTDPQLVAILGLLLQERRASNEWRDGINVRMDRLEKKVDENTDFTKTIQSTIAASKMVTKFIKWAAGLAFALSTLYTVIYMMTHGGALPGGGAPTITPTP